MTLTADITALLAAIDQGDYSAVPPLVDLLNERCDLGRVVPERTSRGHYRWKEGPVTEPCGGVRGHYLPPAAFRELRGGKLSYPDTVPARSYLTCGAAFRALVEAVQGETT